MAILWTIVLLAAVFLEVGEIAAAMVVAGGLLQIDAVSPSIKPSTTTMYPSRLLPCLFPGCVGGMVPFSSRSSQGRSVESSDPNHDDGVLPEQALLLINKGSEAGVIPFGKRRRRLHGFNVSKPFAAAAIESSMCVGVLRSLQPGSDSRLHGELPAYNIDFINTRCRFRGPLPRRRRHAPCEALLETVDFMAVAGACPFGWCCSLRVIGWTRALPGGSSQAFVPGSMACQLRASLALYRCRIAGDELAMRCSNPISPSSFGSKDSRRSTDASSWVPAAVVWGPHQIRVPHALVSTPPSPQMQPRAICGGGHAASQHDHHRSFGWLGAQRIYVAPCGPFHLSGQRRNALQPMVLMMFPTTTQLILWCRFDDSAPIWVVRSSFYIPRRLQQ